MAFRVPTTKISALSPRKEDGAYLDFIRSLPCAVTGLYCVEAAHLSTGNKFYGHGGRGMSRKASDRWALPLSSSEHRSQHDMKEAEYWECVGIDPWVLALALWGIWSDGGELEDRKQRAIETLGVHRAR